MHVIKIDKHAINPVGHLLHRYISHSCSEQLFLVETRSFWIIKFYPGYQVFSVRSIMDGINPLSSDLFVFTVFFTQL